MTSHPRRPGTPLDGLLNLDKPVGLTSARALDQVRAVTGQRKSGHAGTLDPGASGVLIICLGRATKLVERLMDLPKVYRATARLDVTSESLDADSELVPVPRSGTQGIPDAEALSRTFAGLTGEIQQIPPNISAVKVNGVPAYKRARRGEVLQLEPRPVRVYWIRLHAFDWPNLDFEVCCGRGTYIRSLIRDIGVALGTGGCLTSLIREQIGPFTRAAAWTPDALRASPDFHKAVFDFDSARTLLSAPPDVPAPPTASMNATPLVRESLLARTADPTNSENP